MKSEGVAMWRSISALLLLIAVPHLCATAQTGGRLMDRSLAAYEEGKYGHAATMLERLVEEEPENAEAHFLLARLYYRTPLGEDGKAGRAIDRAVELEPDNLKYLVAKLEFLRRDAPHFILEKIRDAERRRLTQRILALDSTNAHAHEELALTYAREYWRYRNALSVPHFFFEDEQGRRKRELEEVDAAETIDESVANETKFSAGAGAFGEEPQDVFMNPSADVMDPSEVGDFERFDLEALKAIGVPVQDLSKRGARAYQKAIRHLTLALEYDSRRRSVYDHLMRIYAQQGAYEQALQMLETMYTQFSEDPETWLYLGIAHLRSSNVAAAATSFREAFKRMQPEDRVVYERIEPFLRGEEEARYADDPETYADQFWRSKDPRYLTPENERQLEHYARTAYADLMYSSDDLDIRGWDTRRGQIYIRYGQPSFDVMLSSNTTAGLSHDIPTSRDRLGEEWGLIRSEINEGTVFNIWQYEDFRFVFEDPFRNGEFQLYSPPATQFANDPGRASVNDYVLIAEETFRERPDRYEYEAPGRDVQLPFLTSSFKGDEGRTELVVQYGVPITQRPDGELIKVNAGVGAFLVGQERTILDRSTHRVYGLPVSNLVEYRDGFLWTDSEALSGEPGEHVVSVEFETGTRSVVGTQRREVTLPDYGEEGLQMSDVMLARSVEPVGPRAAATGGGIVRNGLLIRGVPWSVFRAGEPISLYFEVYGLEQDQERTNYSVEAALVPKEESGGVVGFFRGLFGSREGVAVSFDAAGTEADEDQYFVLDTEDLEPGVYTLTVRITDAVTGARAERSRDLYLE